MAVEERPPKNPRYESESLTFTEDDARHVRYPHNDPLVIIVQIENMKVKRCLVDTGSSVNIIYKSSFERMKLSINDLKPCSQVIYEFTGEGLSPAGTIKLPVTTRYDPKHETVMTEFLIVDCSSAYNVVIGRPLLTTLHATVSIWHLSMKFPTSAGIGCVRGDQREARECYNASVAKARKGAKENNMIVCAEREEVDEMDVDQSFTVVVDQEEMLEEFGQESTLGLRE